MRGTQLKDANEQLLEKLRLGAYAEARRFQTIQSLAFQEIWQKNIPKTTLIIYHKTGLKFDRGNFYCRNRSIKGFL